MKLLLPILCNLCLVLLCDQLGRRTRFRQLSDRTKQWVIGVLFGCMAAFASEYGVPVGGVIMNVRDAAPICAGLIFGAPAGIIAGLIGGLYRWVSVAWGAGVYTRPVPLQPYWQASLQQDCGPICLTIKSQRGAMGSVLQWCVKCCIC